MTVTAQPRQTLFDIALQCCGSVEAAFDIAAMNDISISECIEGLSLQIPEQIDKRVSEYYSKNNIIPATYEYLL